MNYKKLLTTFNAWLILINVAILVVILITNISTEQRIAESKTSVLGVSIPVFDRNMIVSDTAFRSTRAFSTAQSIDDYLVSQLSPLVRVVEAGRTAGTIIFEAARGITSSKWGRNPQLNPGLLLAYLEKEQSLISLSSYNVVTDPEKRIKYAMGYGCPDGASCDDQYAGLSNQLNWAAYQLEYNYFLALRTDISDPYKLNTTITTLDAYSVFLKNAATAANYRYTPHVYWGNYNLWKLIVANGWGDTAETYAKIDIDALNLKNRDISTNTDINPTPVTFAEVKEVILTPPPIGVTNSAVSKLQLFLRDQGFFTYAYITGYYGTITQTALTAFLGSEKYQALIKPIITPPPVITSTCDDLRTRIWSIGQTGGDVTRLQQCLIDQGLFAWNGGPTGYFGPVSQSGLAKWITRINSPVQPPTIPVVSSCDSYITLAKSWTIGRTGQDVRDLQQCLKDSGVFTWPAGVTGYYGNYTQSLLLQPVTSACDTTTAKSWTIGRIGQDVRDLQQCLKDSGVYKWQNGVTGYFGAYTKGLL